MSELYRLVCAPAACSAFADDRFGHCADCGALVCHRPHVDPTWLLVCLDCFDRDASEADVVAVTPATLDELRQQTRRRLH